MSTLDDELQIAADAIATADALVFTAGAGMGVDSGLPDFRGDEGFWKAYPPFRRLGLRFAELADPRWFREDPGLAWGFYGHRLELYRRTHPHAGFAILARWARRPGGAFVFTSNVDGQFQRGGFDEAQIVECHGAIDWLQCLAHCGMGLFRADGIHVHVDDTTGRAAPPWPECPRCHNLARPAILMFGDGDWDSSRTEAQEARFESWLATTGPKLVVVECGAGTAIPTVRRLSESLTHHPPAHLIRINVREPETPSGHSAISLGAREALVRLDARAGS